MKKFLPKSINNPKGFTLIELLVVVAIIALLSVIGIAVFGPIQSRARDARRKADIDAISKAYEVNYDPNNNPGPYKLLTGTDFQGGAIPVPPTTKEGASYTFASGPNAATVTTDSYQVCTTLEGGTTGCNAISATCYCKSAAQATTATIGINYPVCPNAVTITGSCKATTASGVANVFFCPAAPTTIDCNGVASNTAVYPVPANTGYSAVTAGTIITSAVSIYRGANAVGYSPLTVGKCTYSGCQ